MNRETPFYLYLKTIFTDNIYVIVEKRVTADLNHDRDCSLRNLQTIFEKKNYSKKRRNYLLRRENEKRKKQAIIESKENAYLFCFVRCVMDATSGAEMCAFSLRKVLIIALLKRGNYLNKQMLSRLRRAATPHRLGKCDPTWPRGLLWDPKLANTAK